MMEDFEREKKIDRVDGLKGNYSASGGQRG